ncbi:unannotated protein [freshwater metagenome]|uniref:Unannotated protein n=1 Tax=freshwater metagenome TaxID=449393 RepID=A0A6J7ALV0_9ZZZZ|nr:hypothetical protein [Actinomycetota bacterium]
MSEAIAAIKIAGDIIVYIDFDRPLWQNVIEQGRKAIPSLDHFLVDGILGACASVTLAELGIVESFGTSDFEENSAAVKNARRRIYERSDFSLEYVHTGAGDIHIARDLVNFKVVPLVTQVNKEIFLNLISPRRPNSTF